MQKSSQPVLEFQQIALLKPIGCGPNCKQIGIRAFFCNTNLRKSKRYTYHNEQVTLMVVLEEITGKNDDFTPLQFLFTNCHLVFSIFPPKTHLKVELRLNTGLHQTLNTFSLKALKNDSTTEF